MATENSPAPTPASSGWRLPSSDVSLPEVHGSIPIPHGAGFWKKMMAFAGPGLPRRRRLHGPRQLGHRPRRRRPLRLHAAQRHHDLEPDGDSAAGARRAPRHRQRPRSRPGLPRSLLPPGHDRPVDPLRDRHRRLRPRRSARRRDRAQPALRAAAHLGRLPDGARRADRPLPAAPRLPLRRSARRRAHRPDRRLVRRRALAGEAEPGRRRGRLRAVDWGSSATRRCSTSPSASSAPR